MRKNTIARFFAVAGVPTDDTLHRMLVKVRAWVWHLAPPLLVGGDGNKGKKFGTFAISLSVNDNEAVMDI